ncbi:conserved hypothetical protein [Vibrio chagasii]|nr:conserved hypothetical protein [Vibrio chagasii]
MLERRISAIYDSSGAPLFSEAVIMSIKVEPSSYYPSHTLENGEEVIDHKVRVPLKIAVGLMLKSDSYIEVHQAIKTAEKSATPITIQSHVDIYPNMLIESYPYEESGKIRNGLAIQLFLIERMGTTGNSRSLGEDDVENSADSDTVVRGEYSSTNVQFSDSIREAIG